MSATTRRNRSIPSSRLLHRLRLRPVRDGLERLEERVVLSTFEVTSLGNSGDGTLRWAIEQANLDTIADTITFADGFAGTIELTEELPELSTSMLVLGPGADVLAVARRADALEDFRIFTVTAEADIDLAGLTITGGRSDGGAGVENSGQLALHACTVTGNSATFWGGGGILNHASGVLSLFDCLISENEAVSYQALQGGGALNYGRASFANCVVNGNSGGSGGAISNWLSGVLMLTGCTIYDNHVEATDYAYGGGLYNVGVASLTDCMLEANSCVGPGQASGGAIMSMSDLAESLTLTRCIIRGNVVEGHDAEGGGIDLSHDSQMTGCTIEGNQVRGGYYSEGGGISLYGGLLELTGCTLHANTVEGGFGGGAVIVSGWGTLQMTNCTVVDNEAELGGAVHLFSEGDTANLVQCTFHGNQADFGSDLFGAGRSTALACIFDPTSGRSVYSSLVSLGYNLFSGDPGLHVTLQDTDLTFTDPMLTDLADHGGPTWTMAPERGSPAINSIPVTPFVSTDQRGIPRPQGLLSDIGAYEDEDVESASLTVTTLDDVVDAYDYRTSLREAIAVADVLSGHNTITFAAGLSGTIELTASLPDLTSMLTVHGPGAGILTIARSPSADQEFRVFTVTRAADVDLEGLTISGGRTVLGAGILNQGALEMVGCRVTGNTATDRGGGIWNDPSGLITLINCSISGNRVESTEYAFGGGLWNQGEASLTDCTLDANTCTAGYSLGGAIANDGLLTLMTSTVSGNKAEEADGTTIPENQRYALGGGLANTGAAHIRECTFLSNSCTSTWQPGGGAICCTASGTLTMERCRLAGNFVTGHDGDGGAMLTMGTCELTACAFEENRVDGEARASGGAITVTGGLFELTACTLAGNLVECEIPEHANGGAIALGADGAVITNCTLAGNQAYHGGALFLSGQASVALAHCTFHQNDAMNDSGDIHGVGTVTAAGCIFDPATGVSVHELGQFLSLGYNLFSGEPGFGVSLHETDLVNTHPMLGELANNGGPTLTCAPQPGSPAIGAIPGAPFAPVDQRGIARPWGSRSDIGAVEYNGPPETPSLVVTTLDDVVDEYDYRTSLREALAHADVLPGLNAITFRGGLEGTSTLEQGLAINSSVSITGPGPEVITLARGEGEANAEFRIITITSPSVMVSMSDLSLCDGRAEKGGAILNPGRLTLTDIHLSGNAATGDEVHGLGGAIYSTGHLGLFNCVLTDNAAARGGAISTQALGWGMPGTLSMQGCELSGNFATWGGAIDSGGITWLVSCTLEDNEAELLGGAVRSETGSLSCQDTTFTSNETADRGGAIFSLASLNLTGCTFNDNEALGGGAVWTAGGTINGSFFEGNSTGYDGGAIYAQQGVLEVSGCWFIDNQAVHGGAIANFQATVTVSETTLAANIATAVVGNIVDGMGGALSNSDEGSVTLIACSVYGNAAEAGGAITNRGYLEILASELTDNTAIEAGGAIHNDQGELHVTGTTLAGNEAGRGGAIDGYVGSVAATDCRFESNAALTGAGIFNSYATATIAGCTFQSNAAGQSGGGIWIGDGTLVLTGSRFLDNQGLYGAGVHAERTEVSIVGTEFARNSGLLGGALEQVRGQALVSGSTFLENHGGFKGGAIYSQSATLIANDCEFGGNFSNVGGAIYSFLGNAELADCQFGANHAVSGGAISVEEGYVVASGCDFLANQADQGGAVQLQSGTLQLRQGHLVGNTATYEGGAIWSGGNIRVEDCEILQNHSDYAGGGISLRGMYAEIIGCTLAGNEAVFRGGGIQSDGTELHLSDCELTGNTANFEGGAIFSTVYGSVLVAAGCTFSENRAETTEVSGGATARGGAILNASEATLTDCRLEANVCAGDGQADGGAVSCDIGSTLTMIRCEVINNRAESTSTWLSAFGGGIHTRDHGRLVDCTIEGNVAHGLTNAGGGGIYAATGVLELSGCTLNVNTAVADESVWGSIGGALLLGGVEATITNCTLTGNAAGARGGALYAGFSTVNLTHCTFRDNGAIFGNDAHNDDAMTAAGCIFDSSVGDDIYSYGTFASLGYNLFSGHPGTGVTLAETDLVNTDPMLGELADNGGPTWTCALDLNSPAVNAIPGALFATVDQRGVQRPVGPGSDIGAFEYNGPEVNSLIVTTLLDVVDAYDYLTSLREALAYAEELPGADPITFLAGLAGTSTLVEDLEVTSDVTIAGPGPEVITLARSQAEGTPEFRLLTIDSPSVVATISGLTFKHGYSGSGGAIFNPGDLTLENVHLLENTATFSGGAIALFPTFAVDGSVRIARLTIRDSVLSDNVAASFGGAIHSDGGMVTITDTRLERNDAGYGGAIHSVRLGQAMNIPADSGDVTLVRATLRRNEATLEGGGLFVSAGLTITDSTIAANNAGRAGGGITGLRETASIAGTTFSGNTAGVAGGGLYLNTSLLLGAAVTDSTFSDNMAERGAGIFNEGPLTITGSTFSGNTASLAGGGIYNKSDLEVESSTFTLNFARNEDPATSSMGGGIYNVGTAQIAGSTFEFNGADFGGGAIQNADPGDLTVTGRTTFHRNAAAYGGGIGSTGTLRLDEVIVRDNVAPYGGGLALRGTVEIKNTAIDLNHAQFGAGVAVFSGEASITRSVIRSNEATVGNEGSAGGGIMQYPGAAIRIRESTIKANTAEVGGGIYSGGDLQIVDSTFLGNHASLLGGGIFKEVAGLEVSNSTFARNEAPEAGGAIYSYLGSTSINHATFYMNSSRVGGGIENGPHLVPAGGADPTALGLSNTPVGAGAAALWKAAPEPAPANGFEGTLNVRNTIFDQCAGGSIVDRYELAYSGGYNLFSDEPDLALQTTDLTNADARLDPPANNGGFTLTCATRPGSQAVNAIDEAPTVPRDQRGVRRPQGLCTDIGAYENENVEQPGLIVTTLLDVADSFDGETSLREAMIRANLLANHHSVPDRIRFKEGLRGTITLERALPFLSESVVIDGPGSTVITVARGAGYVTPEFRVFTVLAGVTAEIEGLSIANGRANFGGGIASEGELTLQDIVLSDNQATNSGGAVFSSGRLTMTGCTAQDNWASAGGGLAVGGTLTATNLTLLRNHATTYGGGLFLESGNAQLTRATIRDNQATSAGGGAVVLDGTLSAYESTIETNTAELGAGVASVGILTFDRSSIRGNTASIAGGGVAQFEGQLTIVNSTLASNSAGERGGGIYGYLAPMNLTYATLASNTALIGGGICSDNLIIFEVLEPTASGPPLAQESGDEELPEIAMVNTIVAGCAGGSVMDLLGTFHSLGHNLFSDDPVALNNDLVLDPTDMVNTDPLLGPAGTYGGATTTLPLLPGSPAINAGKAIRMLTTDQRGIARTSGSSTTPDIGAFESRGFTVKVLGGRSQSTPVGQLFPKPLSVSVTSLYGEPVAGGVITFVPPLRGASASLTPGNRPVIDAMGRATVTARANSVAGTYNVKASCTGGNPVKFRMTNLPLPATLVPPPNAAGGSTSLSLTLKKGVASLIPTEVGAAFDLAIMRLYPSRPSVATQ